MDIMRYFAIWRSKCLIHIYLGKERQRGFAAFYGDKKKRKLYILGKKNFYDYAVVPPQFTFRFTKQMHKVIDKKLYDKKKAEIQSMTVEEEKYHKIREQRKADRMKLIFNVYKNNPKLSQVEISKMTGLSNALVSTYLKEMKANLLGNQSILIH